MSLKYERSRNLKYERSRTIEINVENSSINLDLIGVFTVLIAVWSLFILKNLYDLYDFRKNRIYYENLLRTKNKG